jgi:hypothetical protein
MVTGGLRSAPKQENIKYLRARRKLPLQKQNTATPNTINDEYDKLKRCAELQAYQIKQKAKVPWIKDETWKLIDARALKSKSRSFQPGERHRLSRRIKRALHRDQKQRTITAGDEIKQNLQAR